MCGWRACGWRPRGWLRCWGLRSSSWTGGVIAREELVEGLAVAAAGTAAVTEAEAERAAASSPAPVPGSPVPPWRDGLSVAVLTSDCQRILGVVERAPVGQGPLKAREIAVGLDLEATPAKVEGVRSKARRVAARGWLLQETPGMFSAGRRPVAAPDAAPSA